MIEQLNPMEILSAEQHLNYGLLNEVFSQELQAIQYIRLGLNEIIPASPHVPIAFSSKKLWAPVALMMASNHISAHTQAAAKDLHLIKTFPFIAHEIENGAKAMILFNENSRRIIKDLPANDPRRLFHPDGTATQNLERLAQALQSKHTDYQNAANFAQVLLDYGLLEQSPYRLHHDDETECLYMISHTAFVKLEGQDLKQLQQKNYLNLIGLLLSLQQNWRYAA